MISILGSSEVHRLVAGLSDVTVRFPSGEQIPREKFRTQPEESALQVPSRRDGREPVHMGSREPVNFS